MMSSAAEWFILCRPKHLILSLKEIFDQIIHTSVIEGLSWYGQKVPSKEGKHICSGITESLSEFSH